MAAYMGSSFTGGLPAGRGYTTMHHAQNRAGREQQGFPAYQPYAIPRNDTIEPGAPRPTKMGHYCFAVAL